MRNKVTKFRDSGSAGQKGFTALGRYGITAGSEGQGAKKRYGFKVSQQREGSRYLKCS